MFTLVKNNSLRYLQVWPAVREYFQQKGEENVYPVIWSFVSNDNIEAECTLYFVHSLMHMFQCAVKSLESDSLTAPEVYNVMLQLRGKLKQRLADKFFGFKALQLQPKLDSNARERFSNSCSACYRRSLTYIEERFNFDENPLKDFAHLTLDEGLSFDNLVRAALRWRQSLLGVLSNDRLFH